MAAFWYVPRPPANKAPGLDPTDRHETFVKADIGHEPEQVRRSGGRRMSAYQGNQTDLTPEPNPLDEDRTAAPTMVPIMGTTQPVEYQQIWPNQAGDVEANYLRPTTGAHVAAQDQMPVPYILTRIRRNFPRTPWDAGTETG